MLTIREDALSLEFLRTKPDIYTLMEAILSDESYDIWENVPERRGIRLVDQAVKRTTGASLSEILGLVELLNEHESAITYDCLTVGMRLHQLGTQDFLWGELLAIVQNSPRFSALHRAQNPDEWMWTENEHLLAAVVDALNWSLYQNGGGKGKAPKPVKRPGVKDDTLKHGKPITMSEAKARLGDQFAELSNTTKT